MVCERRVFLNTYLLEAFGSNHGYERCHGTKGIPLDNKAFLDSAVHPVWHWVPSPSKPNASSICCLMVYSEENPAHIIYGRQRGGCAVRACRRRAFLWFCNRCRRARRSPCRRPAASCVHSGSVQVAYSHTCFRKSPEGIAACSKISFRVDSLIGECLGTGTMLPLLFSKIMWLPRCRVTVYPNLPSALTTSSQLWFLRLNLEFL